MGRPLRAASGDIVYHVLNRTGSPRALLDLILRCRKMKREMRTDGSIPYGTDRLTPCRRKLRYVHTLLAAVGFAGFSRGRSPSGRPSWSILNMVIANNTYK